MTDIFNTNQVTKSSQETTPINSAPTVPISNLAPFHTFSTFVEKPQGMRFNGQQPDEVILVFLRRHFITNVPWIVLTILLLFVPFIVNFVFQVIGFTFSFLPIRFIILLNVFYYTLVFGYAFSNFVSWFYNIGIITQTRIIDIDFTNLSHINVAATYVTEVEEATFQQSGIFASFFDYGTVHARLLAGKDDFIFSKIPHPARISLILSHLLGDKE